MFSQVRVISIPLIAICCCAAWARGQSKRPPAPPKQPSTPSTPVGENKSIQFGTPLNIPVATAGARHLEVNAAVDIAGRVHVIWIEDEKKGRELYYALLDPATNQFSTPVKVRESRGGLQPGARIRTDPDGVVYVVWSEAATAPGSEIRLATSVDGGKTFTRSIRVSDNPRDKAVGMPSIGIGRDGVCVTWLDSRNYAGPQKGADLYYALSTDGGRSFSQFTSLFNQVCDCYQDIAISQKFIVVVFRCAVREIRDVLLRASADGGHTFPGSMRVSVDNWRSNQCPETGAQAIFDRSERLNVVWYSGKENQGDIYFTRSVEQNNQTTFEQKRRISPWSQGRQTLPVLAIDAKDRITVAWQDGKDRLQRIYLTQSLDQGATFPPPAPLPLVHEGANQNYSPVPCLVASPDGSLWLAWTETVKKEQTAHLVKATATDK